MPAPDLQNYQYEMFMPAYKLHNEMLSREGSKQTLAEDTVLRTAKLKDSKRGSAEGTLSLSPYTNAKRPELSGTLYESIKKYGVKTPVTIRGQVGTQLILENGHHRIVAAYDINPNMEIPINYKWVVR